MTPEIKELDAHINALADKKRELEGQISSIKVQLRDSRTAVARLRREESRRKAADEKMTAIERARKEVTRIRVLFANELASQGLSKNQICARIGISRATLIHDDYKNKRNLSCDKNAPRPTTELMQ
jgi:chromosome segregation ATPase